MSMGSKPLAALAPVLERLDLLVERGVAAAELLHGPPGSADPFRGFHVSADDIDTLLAREPGFPTLAVATDGAEPGPLLALGEPLGLSAFELDVVVVALAPEVDLRYERLYGYLQDDVTKKRPTIDLVLNLLCSSAEEKLARRGSFAPDAPLLRERVVRLVEDPSQPEAPLLARALRVDEQVVRLLLGTAGLDPRLAGFCELVDPRGEGTSEPVAPNLQALVASAAQDRSALRLYFRGPPGSGRRATAASLAESAGLRLLVADLGRAAPQPGLWDVLVREARLQQALLYLGRVDALLGQPELDVLLRALASDGSGTAVLAGTERLGSAVLADAVDGLGIHAIEFAPPPVEVRRRLWERALGDAGATAASADLDRVADRFALTPGQIREAAATARAAAGRPSVDELFAAARAQCGHDLVPLALKLEPVYDWDDLVVPEDTRAGLDELCRRVVHRQRVLGEWGFGAKLSLGKGLSALFVGPSGSGKTMAAEVVAGELGLDLYRIDLAGVVSKWIGETEKNLDRIFAAAENANAILFFDEADALFGKRSEVRDSHDRYANVEISYLLQRMEAYEGVSILATNLIDNLDEAFVRRLAFRVHFPFPEEEERRAIWERVWPDGVRLAEDVDLALLARAVPLAGGNIKNIALAAAYLAAGDGPVVEPRHLWRAVRREYEKLGKSVSEEELAGREGE